MITEISNNTKEKKSTRRPLFFPWRSAGIGGVGMVAALICIFAFGSYGFGLFVALPFLVGLVAGAWAVWRDPQISGGKAAFAGLAAAFWGGFFFLVFGFEGIICLVMAMPLCLPMAAVGGWVGWWMFEAPARHHWMLLVLIFLAPALSGAEVLIGPKAPLYRVQSDIIIDAPPEVVWRHVIELAPLDEPDEWLFRLGVAYPVGATIEGKGVGAVRHCRFNTGDFVEPIEVWDAPRRLAFRVDQNPQPMEELSPHAHVHAPHLHGFFEARRGRFDFEPLPGGRTRLVGTTEYQHNLWPASYWRRWSDPIIHAIHHRVLAHVQTQVKAEMAEGGSP